GVGRGLGAGWRRRSQHEGRRRDRTCAQPFHRNPRARLAQRTLSRIFRALHSPPIRELRSAASVKESKAPPPPPPTTFGTGTGAGGGAPLETTRLTAKPLATLVPAAGLSLITLPGATVVLDCIVTVPRVRPALVMALVAAACIWPTTFGTSTVGGGGDPICTSACVWPSTTREWMTLTGTPRGLW